MSPVMEIPLARMGYPLRISSRLCFRKIGLSKRDIKNLRKKKMKNRGRLKKKQQKKMNLLD